MLVDSIEAHELFEINKAYLIRYRKKKALIRSLVQRYNERKARTESIQSKQLTFTPGGGTPVTLDDRLIKLENLAERINQYQDEARAIRNEICSKLDMLENVKQSEVLELYFIDELTLESVADEMTYSLRQIYRLYADGVRSVEID